MDLGDWVDVFLLVFLLFSVGPVLRVHFLFSFFFFSYKSWSGCNAMGIWK